MCQKLCDECDMPLSPSSLALPASALAASLAVRSAAAASFAEHGHRASQQDHTQIACQHRECALTKAFSFHCRSMSRHALCLQALACHANVSEHSLHNDTLAGTFFGLLPLARLLLLQLSQQCSQSFSLCGLADGLCLFTSASCRDQHVHTTRAQGPTCIGSPRPLPGARCAHAEPVLPPPAAARALPRSPAPGSQPS